MRKVLDFEKARKDSCPETAFARTQFHLSQVLVKQNKNLKEAEQLSKMARKVLERTHPLEDLKNVAEEHELAKFDHLQPVFDGRFTGLSILKYVSWNLP